MRPDCTIPLGPAVLRAVEQRRGGVYSSAIDLWPDDWAASLRTAGRTFRLPLPDDRQSSLRPLWGAAFMHPAVKGHPMGFGAQFGWWAQSGRWTRFQAMRCDTGIPSRVIRFSTAQPTRASVFWAGRVRARRPRPMTAL